MSLKRSLQFFRPDAGRIGLVLGVLVLSIGLNVLKPWPVALIVDHLLTGRPLPAWLEPWMNRFPLPVQLALGCGAILALHLGQGALYAWQNYLSIGIGLRGLSRVRIAVFTWLQRLSLRFHYGSRAGDLIYRASWDTYSFQTLFQQGLMTFVTGLVTLVLMLIFMAHLNGSLTLLALAIVPFLWVVIHFFARQMSRQSAAAQQADSQVTSLVQQSIAQLPLVLSYTREQHEAERFAHQVAIAEAERRHQHKWEILYGLAIAVVFGVATALLTWAGARQVLAGRLTVGQLLIFLAYLAQLYEPLNQLSHVGATVASAGAGARRVLEILDTPEEVKDAPDARPVIRAGDPVRKEPGTPPPLILQGTLRFHQVSFGYQEGREVLHDLDFVLQSGESAAVIGPSGVGKTTLMNLVPRFYDPTRGHVSLDGEDLRHLRLHDLRSMVGLVPQEPIILPGTVAENIAYGKPHASAEEIAAAARAAHADEFIRRLPRQYETEIGEGSARLSVGERQRINLARAFLKNPPILLLDEPTSALDGESEALVGASLEQLVRGRTTLMVAHRLSTIRRVQRILVLQEGRLVENGAPEELLGRGGYYSRVAGGQVAIC